MLENIIVESDDVSWNSKDSDVETIKEALQDQEVRIKGK